MHCYSFRTTGLTRCQYANRAKDIKATAVRNVVNVDFHITRYKQMVAELQDQVCGRGTGSGILCCVCSMSSVFDIDWLC
jgi:hypothetical protein